MSQSVLLVEPRYQATGFSIGICAADSAANLGTLVEQVESENYPHELELRKIILIASACEPESLSFVRELAQRDRRLVLIEEAKRRGKFAAINQIIENSDGQFLVLVNSDALPERGAIPKLLQEIAKHEDVGMISACPIVGRRAGVTGRVVRLLWGIHNEFLRELDQGDLNNRSCDELSVLRAKALHKLPPGTVNDGAYLAGAAHLDGYSIRFCDTARVRIDVPSNLVDVIRQRRRIVYGHFQIWESVGQAPKTMESTLMSHPFRSLSILVRSLAASPALIPVLPVAVIGEIASTFFAIWDSVASSRKHVMWRRYGTRS